MLTPDNQEIEELKLKLKNAEIYNSYLTDLYDNVRTFKHDFDNIMNSINGYIKADDMNGLKEYFSEFQKHSNIVKNISILNPKTINNPAIYNLITSKYEKACNLNINVNLEIFLDFNRLNMPIYEFSKILGILIDNAIEASKDCTKKEINIHIRESLKQGIQIISIENTYPNKNIDTNKIFAKGISSKKGHCGIGLWEVNKILIQNKNVSLNTTIDNNFFKQELQINLR